MLVIAHLFWHILAFRERLVCADLIWDCYAHFFGDIIALLVGDLPGAGLGNLLALVVGNVLASSCDRSPHLVVAVAPPFKLAILLVLSAAFSFREGLVLSFEFLLTLLHLKETLLYKI